MNKKPKAYLKIPKNPVSVSNRIRSVTIAKANRLMLCEDTIAL